jgi:hypothetical protein
VKICVAHIWGSLSRTFDNSDRSTPDLFPIHSPRYQSIRVFEVSKSLTIVFHVIIRHHVAHVPSSQPLPHLAPSPNLPPPQSSLAIPCFFISSLRFLLLPLASSTHLSYAPFPSSNFAFTTPFNSSLMNPTKLCLRSEFSQSHCARLSS